MPKHSWNPDPDPNLKSHVACLCRRILGMQIMFSDQSKMTMQNDPSEIAIATDQGNWECGVFRSLTINLLQFTFLQSGPRILQSGMLKAYRIHVWLSSMKFRSAFLEVITHGKTDGIGHYTLWLPGISKRSFRLHLYIGV